MLNEPLISLILLLFLLIIAAVLTVWFALTLLGGSPTAVPRDKSTAPGTNRRNERLPREIVSQQPVVTPRVSRQVTIRPHDKPQPETPRPKETKPVLQHHNTLPIRRVSNDQFRGAKVKARRRDETQNQPKETEDSLEDAFERFIRSKNDDLNF
jgi:hypothetical protein